MTYAQKYGLRPADRIVEPIFTTGISKHHAIYLGIDYQGNEWMAENHKFKGVQLVPASQYFQKTKKVNVVVFNGSDYERQLAVQRALSLLGQPYDLINFNCEHYAELVQSGKGISHQVEIVGKVLLTCGATILAILILKTLSKRKAI
jgi:hypothetical protein